MSCGDPAMLVCSSTFIHSSFALAMFILNFTMFPRRHGKEAQESARGLPLFASELTSRVLVTRCLLSINPQLHSRSLSCSNVLYDSPVHSQTRLTLCPVSFSHSFVPHPSHFNIQRTTLFLIHPTSSTRTCLYIQKRKNSFIVINTLLG